MTKNNFMLFALSSLRSSALLHTYIIASLLPWFVTGFSDAEGCFYIRVTKKNKMKTG
jgi:hypothetical protein